MPRCVVYANHIPYVSSTRATSLRSLLLWLDSVGVFVEKEVLDIEAQIVDQSYEFDLFIGSLSELTDQTFYKMPQYLQSCVIPEVNKARHIKVSDRENIVLGALFLQSRMLSRCIGSTYT